MAPGYNTIPDNPNRDYVRWFKKINKIKNMPNEQVKEIIAGLKQQERSQMIRNLNDMIDISGDMELDEDDYYDADNDDDKDDAE